MDYEQKYNEALEKARKLYNDAKANEYKSDMEDYESIFPELAESEDEQVRKGIVKFIVEQYPECWKDKKNKMLAYLEKQKEQKPVDLSDMMVHKEPYIAPVPTPMVADEQKPAEWSEEDEKDMAHIIRILDDCYVYGTHDLSKTDHENLVNKLKSLRPSWKPSEEELAKKHLDGYCMGREDTLREMKDFVESHFNCENAKKGMPIVYNTQSGTSTLKAEG